MTHTDGHQKLGCMKECSRCQLDVTMGVLLYMHWRLNTLLFAEACLLSSTHEQVSFCCSSSSFQLASCDCRYQEMTKQELFAWGLPESMAQWQWDMYQYTINLGYYAPEHDLLLSRTLNPDSMTWKGFLQSTAFDGSQTLSEVRALYRHA